MPQRTHHNKSSFKAQHLFTDREAPRQIFADGLSQAQGAEEYRTLNFYGIGGQGKSALAEQFILKMEQEKQDHSTGLAWAQLNFELIAQRETSIGLLAIRLQLGKQGKIPFPAFDTAFARYFSFAYSGQDIQSTHPDLFSSSDDILQDLEGVISGVIDLVPGAGFFYKYLDKLNSKTQQWWQKRGKEILADIDTLEQHKLMEKLPVYLGADLHDWLFQEKNKNKNRRLVIVLDTYEALWRNKAIKSGLEAMRIDAWIRKLVEETPGILYVMLGRDKLEWAENQADWQGCIEAHLLGGLSAHDAEQFLLHVPIIEDDIRQRIIKSANGIPFYLDIQVDLYEQIKQQSHPEAEQFGGKETQILARFTDHLDNNTLRSLKIIAHSRLFNENMAHLLGAEFMGSKTAISIKQITHYSFWKQEANNWLLHQLMRDYLQEEQAKEEPELFKEIHQFLFSHYNNKLDLLENVIDIQEQHKYDLLEASYHKEIIAIEDYLDWLNKQIQLFIDAYAWEQVEPLLKHGLELAETQYGSEDINTATILNNLALLYQSQGKYEQAESLFQRALSIREKALGKEHPEVAITLNNLAQLYRSQGKYEQVDPLYQRALSIREKALGKEHPDVATTMNSLALLYESQGKYEQAEPLFQRSLSIYEKALGKEHPQVATTLNNLAGLYESQSKYEQAEPLYQRSLSVKEKALGKEHPDVATTLNNLAALYESQGKYEQADPLYQRSLSINEKALGKEHPYVAATLNNLAHLYQSQGKYEQAEPLYQRTIPIKEKALGKEHPDVAITLNNLAKLYYSQGKYEQAEPLYQRALLILEQAFPNGHPNIDTLKANYNALKNKMSPD